ncbi:hypothetical protein CDL15_Pgr003090 [Punica granatum]|uniref:Uncharacterized protein n=1 Tax=Punica granatum TaxID=22663 RepID=A0A218X2G4_PUNGR|nr:hypothetical protein CDL15_Pgr003090 [Punica granatum]PKI32614.1 hypothetical protein CRG98_047011 [Punica granatum]
MAGLQQYYFFPTDFFYPRPSSDAASKAAAVLPVQAFKDDSVDPVRTTDCGPEVVPTTSAPMLALNPSAIKRELCRGTPIIAEQKKFPDA